MLKTISIMKLTRASTNDPNIVEKMLIIVIIKFSKREKKGKSSPNLNFKGVVNVCTLYILNRLFFVTVLCI